jgi:hypothetical protein
MQTEENLTRVRLGRSFSTEDQPPCAWKPNRKNIQIGSRPSALVVGFDDLIFRDSEISIDRFGCDWLDAGCIRTGAALECDASVVRNEAY